ncbi:hypothetical protein [uncultured Gammaproteobacteria bacterium]|nr:hypothetical protein [uncultured Gammaproteobacteria bacterium]CAC9961811.1 hypothetical protein [uncultured Gammaproteobacteria bacterium]CAC9996227.1 hypothetical protein [uncultured Gammaproteobacteria bacterium]
MIYHHIGGLEKSLFLSPQPPNHLPPHRWLRNVCKISETLIAYLPPHRWLRNETK